MQVIERLSGWSTIVPNETANIGNTRRSEIRCRTTKTLVRWAESQRREIMVGTCQRLGLSDVQEIGVRPESTSGGPVGTASEL
jgi:hypothetical protein